MGAGNSSRGFSLLEVLTALTILSIAMAALYESFSNGLGAVARSEDHIKARILSQSLLAEILAYPKLDIGIKTGKAGKYQWFITVAPLNTEAKVKGKAEVKWQLVRIRVRVSWGRRGGVQLERLKLAALNE